MDRANTPPPPGLPYHAPGAEPPTRVRFTVMGFLGVLAFLTYFDRFFITRAQADIKADLGISDAQMGLIMGAFWLAYALFELPAGWMGDRFGARSTLTRIVLAWSLFTALSGSAVGFLSLLTLRFLFGVGEAGAYPNMARVQSRWLPVASRPRASGLLWLMSRWGGAFSPLLFGWMMRTFDSPGFRSSMDAVPGLSHVGDAASWRIGFWASGLLGVVWVVAFWGWFRDHPSEKPSVNRAELALITRDAPPEVRGHTMPRPMWRALMRSPSLWAIGVYYLCGSFGWSFFASWMPKYFKDVQGVAYQQSEWMAAAPLFCGGVMCLVGGTLSQALVARTGRLRFGRAIFPLVGASTAALSMFLIPYMQTPAQATVLLCIASAAFDFGQAANWATIVDIGGKYAGTAAGFINMIGNLGNAFQPYVGALIFGAFGWNVLFVVYSAAFLIAASMWLFINPARRFYDDEPGPERAGFDAVPVAPAEAAARQA